MILDVEFEEMNSEFEADFGEVIVIKPGGKTYSDGLAEGEVVGRDKEWNEFWDAYQSVGNRKTYDHAFCYLNSETFKPKYAIKPTSAQYMLQYTDISKIPDNVVLDLSEATSVVGCFLNGKFEYLGVIDCSSSQNISQLLRLNYVLKTVEKLILPPKQTTCNLAFDACPALENIVIEGVFNQSVDFKSSAKLTKDSTVSIMNSLSTEVSGKTASFSKNAVNNAFETATGLADGVSSEEWLALVAAKSNWTISLG